MVRVGRKSSDYEGRTLGTRGYLANPLARVRKFPHGKCDVREQFFRLVKAFNTTPGTSLHLMPYRYPDVRMCNPGRETQSTLLSTNPWDVHPERCPMPQEYYPAAYGTTDVWVEYWHAGKGQGFWAWLNDLSNPPTRSLDLFLEVSCLTWSYGEMLDYETDLVIELIKSMNYTFQEVQYLTNAAGTLAEQLANVLDGVPPSEESRQRRQARVEMLQRAEQERIDQLARQAAEQQAGENARLQEAADQAARAARERAARTVTVIYDASYLMSDMVLLHESGLLDQCAITNLVPVEVQEEIEKHLKPEEGSEKRRRASKARQKCLGFKEKKRQWARYEEVRMGDFVTRQHYSRPLMSDSRTDSLLFEYAKYLLQGKSQVVVREPNDGGRKTVTIDGTVSLPRVVVIATNDWGIRNLVHEERAQTGLNLFSISNPRDLIQTGPLRNALYCSAVIESATIAFDATDEKGLKGMRVHATFRSDWCRSDPCSAFAFFFQKDGQALKGFSPPYSTVRGELCVGAAFVSQYDHARHEINLFLPYGEMRLLEGTHELKFQVGVYRLNNCLAWSNYGDFSLTVHPAPPTNRPEPPAAAEGETVKVVVRIPRLSKRMDNP